jgi:hypothetical protein
MYGWESSLVKVTLDKRAINSTLVRRIGIIISARLKAAEKGNYYD